MFICLNPILFVTPAFFVVRRGQEMIESIRESVVYMAHTHDGARVAMHCLWHGTAKVCMHIVKLTHKTLR